MESVGITSKFTQSLVNGILQIWGFILGLTSAFFVDKIGRRPLFRISTIGMLITFIAWSIASANFSQTGSKAAGMAVMAFIFIFTLFFGIAFTPLPVAYSVEILPYSIRAKGMAMYVFSTKAAVFVNQYGKQRLSSFKPRSFHNILHSQSHRPRKHWLAILPCLRGHPRRGVYRRLRVFCRDQRKGT